MNLRKKYLLLVKFKRNLRADSLEFPPLASVEAVDHVHVVCHLHELRHRVLLRIQDCNHEFDPVVESAWLNQEWKQTESVALEEDLCNSDHYPELIGLVSVSDYLCHYVLKLLEEMLCYRHQHFPLAIFKLVLECAH